MKAVEVIDEDEKRAWSEYRETIRNVPETRYDEVEPWAWAKLQGKLKTIDARRGALRRAA